MHEHRANDPKERNNVNIVFYLIKQVYEQQVHEAKSIYPTDYRLVLLLYIMLGSRAIYDYTKCDRKLIEIVLPLKFETLLAPSYNLDWIENSFDSTWQR